MKHDIKKQLKTVTANRAWIPNLITTFRILGAITMLFLGPQSREFYVVYALCGLSDLLDGFLARKLRTASAFGAKLDSIADLSFYSVMLVRLLPVLRRRLPEWIWYLVGLVLCIRLSSYLVAAIRLHQFASLHSVLNKITGASVFGIGLALLLTNLGLTIYCLVVFGISFSSSTQELIHHIKAPPIPASE